MILFFDPMYQFPLTLNQFPLTMILFFDPMYQFLLTLNQFPLTMILFFEQWSYFSHYGLVFTPQVFSPASHLLLFHNKSPIPIDKPFQKSTFPSVLHQKSPSHFSNLIAEIPFNVSPSSIVQGFFRN